MKFKNKLESLWRSVDWGRKVIYSVGAILLAAVTLVFPTSRSEVCSFELVEAIAAISGMIFAAYSIAIAVMTKIEPLTNNGVEKEKLLAKFFTLFTFTVIIQSVTLGILFIFEIDDNSVLRIIVNGLMAGCLLSIADIALSFFRLESGIRKKVKSDVTRQEGRMFSLVFIQPTIIIIMLMMFVHRDNGMKGYDAETKKIIKEKEAEITRLKSDSMRLETLLKGKDIHIGLDVQGIPQRRGGGITVNNVQGN